MNWTLLFALVVGLSVHADDGLRSMTLEDLLNISTSVASGVKDKVLTPRESPGIISIITEEDMRKHGYRDVADVLQMVPGFEVQGGADNQGTFTPSLRGMKAGEGKMLLRVNGFDYTDPSYVNVQVFNRFPIDAIRQIEIIRGPGSALYGGWAELTVVNVILKEGVDLNGFLASGFGSQMAHAPGRRNLLVSMGKKNGDFSYSMHGFYGKAEVSDREFTDERGESYRYDKKTGFNSKSINIASTYKNLTMRFVDSAYASESTDEVWGGPLDRSYDVLYNMMGTGVSYDHKFADMITLTPMYEFTRWKAWSTPGEWARTGATSGYFNNDTFNKSRFGLTGLIKPAQSSWDILVGADSTHFDVTFDNTGWSALHQKFYYSNLGVFTQGTFTLGHFNFTAGARQESTTVNHKSALVPRAGLTAVFGDFHFKALYSQAFRAPSATQYLVKQDPNLRPEKAFVDEIEVGYKLTPTQFITANFYDILIRDYIRYDNLGYANTGGAGTRGFEVEYKNIQSWGNAAITGSMYSATKFSFPAQKSEKDNHAFLGIPRYKITATGTYDISQHWSVTPSMIYEKGVYAKVDINNTNNGYVHAEPERDLGAAKFDLYVLNSGFLGHKDTDLGFGIYNVTDARTYYPNTVNSGQPPPNPAGSREIGLKVTSRF